MIKRTKLSFLWGLVAVFSLAGCGGGGGGGDEGGNGGEPAPTVPEVLNYSVAQQWFSAKDLLRLSFEGTEFELITVGLQGTYNRTTQAATLSANTGMSFRVSPYGEIDPLDVSLLIPDGYPVQWVGEKDPTAGAFQVNIPQGLFDFDRIFVEVNNLPGVTITAFAGPDAVAGTSLTWQQFDDVEDDDAAPPYQKIARLAYSAWQVVFEQVHIAYTSLSLTVANDAALEANKSYVATGEVFPGTGVAGTLKIDWIDASGNGELGPGDTFNTTFTDWWVNDPDDNIDDLYNGLLILTGYTENPNSVGGDFSFSDFRKQETENNEVDPGAVTVNGGFNLTYSW